MHQQFTSNIGLHDVITDQKEPEQFCKAAELRTKLRTLSCSPIVTVYVENIKTQAKHNILATTDIKD